MRSLTHILLGLSWMIAFGALVALAAVSVGILTTPVLGYLAALAVLVLLPLITQIVTLIRRRRAAAVLSYVEQAVRLNLPLPRMLNAAQRSEHGRLASRLGEFRKRLEDAYPLGAALQTTIPEI